MSDQTFLDWPFLEDRHRRLARDLDAWAGSRIESVWERSADLDGTCRAIVRRLAEGGWLSLVAREGEDEPDRYDVRAICVARETLARHGGLADFAFAMQGLGVAPVALFGSGEQRARVLPAVRRGEAIAAFALSESEAGSDVRAMRTTAHRQGRGYVLQGEKTWISNAGIADFYVVFARMPDEGEQRFGAFLVEAEQLGLTVAERIEMIAPHPLGTIRLEACEIDDDALIGAPGDGLRVAFGTLDVFRTTVGAAALGFARRALAEALGWVTQRSAFGKPLAEHQLTQARLADMATAIDASALMVYRAAWARDTGSGAATREAAMAKLFATEAAQGVIDDAVQLFGGRGVVSGAIVERLYREIRALRIYEGTSEIQKLVIAGQLIPRDRVREKGNGKWER